MRIPSSNRAPYDDGVSQIELKTATGYTKAELWILDLADFASVKRFGDQWETDGGRLDILVANAAMETRKYTTTKDGWETTCVLYLFISASSLSCSQSDDVL